MAVWTNFLGGKLEWKPSHGNEQTLWSREYGKLVLWSTTYWCVYVGLIALFAAAHRFPLGDVTYYSVILWACFNTIINGLFIYKNLQYMHHQKRAGVLSGKVKYNAFQWWRLKTIGLLAAYVIAVVTLAGFAGKTPQLALWMNRTFPEYAHTEPAKPGSIAASDVVR